MRSVRLLASVFVGVLFYLPLAAAAQDTQLPQNAAPPPDASAPVPQEQLDGLLALIALYPDQLLTQVLIASTYPLEVIEAARFVKANPELKGQSLDDALKEKTWDASVLSLASFPQVLDMMNDKLDWTQQLGDAFLRDEAGVMRTVQSLRERAQQAGNLQTTEQQKVVVQDRVIYIEPAQPQYLYVPVYNPTIIYGPWWWPSYRPWIWYPPPIWGYPPRPPGWGYTAGFYWGARWGISYNNWGWARPNWNSYNVNININNNNYWLNRPQYRDRYPNGTGNWNHMPEHRKGVAYRDPVTTNKYRPTNPAAVASRENYRGKDLAPSTRPGASAGQPATRPGPSTGAPATRPATDQGVARPTPSVPGGQPATRPSPPTGQTGARPSPSTTQNMPRPMPGSSTQPATRPAPTYQTPSRPQAQMESSRGQASRQTMNARPPEPASRPGSAPPQRSNQPARQR